MTEIIYDENWVMSRRNRSHGLNPIRKALHSAKDPQDAIHTVHIAGTNGKGSTTNYLKDILMSQGYKVGTFTSPHLIAHRDRIRINGEWIREDVFHEYLMKFLDIILEEDLGMFEIDTLIAFTWMRDQKVDYALIETGLGGRLDNTNVIAHPDLEVITTIGYDHMAILGNRLQQIAYEKAGIIKPYSRCIVGYLDPQVQKVISLRAARMHASLTHTPSFDDLGRRTFRFRNTEYTLGSDASYQKKNASVALYAAWKLGVDITLPAVQKAVEQSSWLGRFEKAGEDPCLILDGAHNEEGIRALTESLAVLQKPLVIVFSALRDKPGRRMADLLRRNCNELVITEFVNSRADTVKGLSSDETDRTFTDFREAIEYAKQAAGKQGTVLVTGSLYFISLVREYLNL